VVHSGVSIPWYVFAIGGGLITFILAWIGIATSMRLDLLIILLIITCVILAAGSDSGNTVSVFNPANATKGFSGIGFGMIFALQTMASTMVLPAPAVPTITSTRRSEVSTWNAAAA
jgi:hypothetical protein